ncbi:hypothetical protein KP509_19G023600 [Ceratopteris richardii]|uniref:Uncharacterized protein WOXA n=1 Tax=Ceratopteris richardii TaxID=49495 RepID=G8YXX0_CERRI|nr:hypothetical protein KP509_19G023600 [Ceratopteris richardii]CBX45506.1 hypothetical protein [Ceratopteris richardii]
MYPGDQQGGNDYRLLQPYINPSAPPPHDPQAASASPQYPTSSSIDPPVLSKHTDSLLYQQASRHYLQQQLELEQQHTVPQPLRHQWSPCPPLPQLYPSQADRMAAPAPCISAEEQAAIDTLSRHASLVTPTYLSREEAQLLMSGTQTTQPVHLQGLNTVEQLLLKEHLMQAGAMEKRIIYENPNLQPLGQAMARTSTSPGADVAGGGGAMPRSYAEETCSTPRPRWTPTQEQIQILESIFNSGTTTPSRDMIVDIAAQLRNYGNIGEANVFYWFQNRKARAKRKLQQPAPVVSPAVSASLPPSTSHASSSS